MKKIIIGLSTLGSQKATATLPLELFKQMAIGYVKALPSGTTSEILASFSTSVDNATSVQDAVELAEEFILQRSLIEAVKYDNWMPFEVEG